MTEKQIALNNIGTLKNIASKSISEQKEIYENAPNDWQQDTKQRNDITILGIKI